MRTKVIYFLSALFLIGVMFLSTPATSLASPSGENTELAGEYSKKAKVTKKYGLNEPIPQTYDYNVAGWSGTLDLVAWIDKPNFIKAEYEGTVTCRGKCPLPMTN